MELKIKVAIAALMLCGAMIGCGPSQADIQKQADAIAAKEKADAAAEKQKQADAAQNAKAKAEADEDAAYAAAREAIKPSNYKEGDRPGVELACIEARASKSKTGVFEGNGSENDNRIMAELDETQKACKAAEKDALDQIDKRFPAAEARSMGPMESNESACLHGAGANCSVNNERLNFATGCQYGYTTDRFNTITCNSKPVDVRIVP